MEIEHYITKYKNIYQNLLEFIESEDEKEINESFKNLITIIEHYINDEVIRETILIVSKISNNYKFNQDIYNKITKIISHYSAKIKQIFPNYEIFNLFYQNKRVLLFLFKAKIIIPADSIIRMFMNQLFKYGIYFLPEIQDFIDKDTKQYIIKEATKYDPNIFNDFESKREKGENDNILLEMIRSDSIQNFIQYMSQTSIPLNATIKSSVFESNSFLIYSNPTLIEYAAFFNSIQTFQYLMLNGVPLMPSLWIYAIHGKSVQTIHLLEENHVEYDVSIINESVQCHHNNIAEYFINNLMEKNDMKINKENIKNEYINDVNINENIVSYSIEFHNYRFFPSSNKNTKYVFFYLSQFNYTELVSLYLQYMNIDYQQYQQYSRYVDDCVDHPINQQYQHNHIALLNVMLHN